MRDESSHDKPEPNNHETIEEEAILLRNYDDGLPHRPSSEARLLDIFTVGDHRQHKSWHLYSKLRARPIIENAARVFPSLLKDFIRYLLPSFMQTRKRTEPTKPPHPTAYLDGLRGVAALLVAISHFLAQFAPELYEGYGSGPKKNAASNTFILQLPLLRIITAGQFMVVLFYIMSGCVLSIKGLKQARNNQQAGFTKTLTSSVFRRWVRLHLPVIAAMAISMLISRAQGWRRLSRNWLDPPQSFKSHRRSPAELGLKELASELLLSIEPRESYKSNSGGPVRLVWYHQMAPRMETMTGQLRHWLHGVVAVCDPFLVGRIGRAAGEYNAGGVLWTIPSEWLGSMVVFLVLLGMGWTPGVMRPGLIMLVAIYAHLTSKWDIASFLSGMLIAELMLYRQEKNARTHNTNVTLPVLQVEVGRATSHGLNEATKSAFRHKSQEAFMVAMFVAGIYLGCLPYSYPGSSLGFRTLWKSIPSWYPSPKKFYLCIGSVFVMISLTYSRPLQRFFSTSPIRYLGRISFSLYLLHSQIIRSIGIPIMSGCMQFVGGGNTLLGYIAGFTLGFSILASISIWASDLFCRAIDEQSVELARKLAERFLVTK